MKGEMAASAAKQRQKQRRSRHGVISASVEWRRNEIAVISAQPRNAENGAGETAGCICSESGETPAWRHLLQSGLAEAKICESKAKAGGKRKAGVKKASKAALRRGGSGWRHGGNEERRWRKYQSMKNQYGKRRRKDINRREINENNREEEMNNR
jgi:hypothetical protein